MILEAVIFFSLALGLTTIVALTPHLIAARFWLSLVSLAAALALTAWLGSLVLGDQTAALDLAIVVAVVTLLIRVVVRRWSWVGAQLFTCVMLAALAYIVYAATQTYAVGLSVGVMAASTVLLLLEIFALSLSVSYAFEIIDVLSRREQRLFRPQSRTLPWVALQVATYNEPVAIVQRTLHALAQLDYPKLLVQVVDNNTEDPSLWRPLERLCEQLGPRFQFMHLADWPGYKSGALNEATRRLAAQVEIVGVIDADYVVQPNFLRATVGHFDDPTVGFVQSSQNYRDWHDSKYLRGLFHSFRYFFDVTMPSRNHRNAIIFCGTMGLIRRSALQRIGGWSETCITEDAEASLRMLGHGYRGVYDRGAYGAGMMPLDFDGLKKQRFRWALGGIQILRLWWRDLLPFGRRKLRLTFAQRMHYLLGSVQWFGEPVTAAFTFLLLVTALVTSLHHQLPLRQLTGAVLVVPLAFALTGVTRALWAMRKATSSTWSDAVQAMRIWFALSWVVTLACLRGLISTHATFLRTPKEKTGAALLNALRSARMESVIAIAAVAGGLAMMVASPSLATFLLGGLLLFESAVYASAPAASIAAEGIRMTPERREWASSPQNTGDRPARRSVLFGGAVALGAAAFAAGIAALVAMSPPDTAPFTHGNGGNLPPIGGTPAPTSTPSASPTPTATPTPTTTPTTTLTLAPTPAPTATPIPTPKPPPG